MVKVNFVFGFERLLPMLGFQHVLMVFIVIAIILLSLLLAGCSSSSPLIPSIYLMSIWYDRSNPEYSPAQADPGIVRNLGAIVGDARLEARVGYFGVCINSDGGSWLCSGNASSLAAQVDSSDDPLNIIWVADTFKANIVFPYLLIVAVVLATLAFLLLATYPNFAEESDGGALRPRLPGRFISQIALAIIFVSAIFVLVSVLWQHTASVAAATIAANLGNGSIEAGVGVSAMVLGWFSFALLIIVVIGLLVMILSIRLVEQMESLRDDVYD